MNKLYKSDDGQNHISSKEEQRADLYSNNVHSRCSSLDFKSNSEFATEEMKLDYLAGILVDIFLTLKDNELQSLVKQNQKGSHLLQGFYKGTGGRRQ